MRKLEIGSGNLPQDGYEHLDLDPNCPHLEYCAPMDNIPVEDNSFDEVLSVHVIEHQSWRDTVKILKEWIRVTKPGGFVHVITPNLRFVAQSYLDSKRGGTEWKNDYNVMHQEEQAHLQADGRANCALWANFKLFSSTGGMDIHYACYDADLLCSKLREAGASRTEVLVDGSCLTVRGFK